MFVCTSLHSTACLFAGQGQYMRRRPDLVAALHHAFSRPELGCSSAGRADVAAPKDTLDYHVVDAQCLQITRQSTTVSLPAVPW